MEADVSGAMVIISNGLPDGYEPPSMSLDPPPPLHDHRKTERFRAESCGQVAPMLGLTDADAAANLRGRLGHCPHGLAEEVVLTTGEVVAAVCPTCWETLPASFVGSAWKP